MSKVHTVPVFAVLPGSLGNVCCHGHDKRDRDVLEYKGPGPLIAACQPVLAEVLNGAELTRYHLKLPSPLFDCGSRSKKSSRNRGSGTVYMTSKRK